MEHPEIVKLKGKVKTVFRRHGRMICASAVAEGFYYQQVTGTNGCRWFYPANVPNPGDYILVSNPHDTGGFAGRTLKLALDTGDSIDVKGPWHTNSDALKAATGVDLTSTHSTRVWISRRRKYNNNLSLTLHDVLYEEPYPRIGAFSRSDVIADRFAEKYGEVIVYVESAGGSSCGPRRKKQHDIPADRE